MQWRNKTFYYGIDCSSKNGIYNAKVFNLGAEPPPYKTFWGPPPPPPLSPLPSHTHYTGIWGPAWGRNFITSGFAWPLSTKSYNSQFRQCPPPERGWGELTLGNNIVLKMKWQMPQGRYEQGAQFFFFWWALAVRFSKSWSYFRPKTYNFLIP